MSLRTIETEQDLKEGVSFICEREPRFEKVLKATGLPPLRRKQGGLRGLLEVITEQQISIQAAAAIWARMEASFAPFDIEQLLQISDEQFAECGQSRPKIRTIRAVLEAISNGKLSLTNMSNAQNDEVFSQLTAIKGIGPWTAHIYLLTNIGRTDIWPVGDLALQESARMLFDLETRPDTKQMLSLAEPWQPWRAVAARLLWSHYRHVRLEGRKQ